MKILLCFDKPEPLFPSTRISITTDISTFRTELNVLYKNIVLTFFEEHNIVHVIYLKDQI